MIQHAIQDHTIPGAVTVVCRNGKIIYHKSFGKSNTSTNTPFKNKCHLPDRIAIQGHYDDCCHDAFGKKVVWTRSALFQILYLN